MFSTAWVSGASTARSMPSASAASAAIWPGPMALVTIASASPRAGGARVRVSIAASRSCRRETVSTPARARAASNTASARPVGSIRRLPARRATTGAQPGRGAGGGQEGPAVAHAADIQQDRPDAGLARQEVQHLREADSGIAADADDLAESDPVRLRPVQHRPAQRCGLRHQRHPPWLRRQVRQRGVQLQRRAGNAERPGAQHADAGRGRGLGNVRHQAERDGREHVPRRQPGQQRADRLALRGDDGQVRDGRVVAGMDRPGETALAQVREHRVRQPARCRTRRRIGAGTAFPGRSGGAGVRRSGSWCGGA